MLLFPGVMFTLGGVFYMLHAVPEKWVCISAHFMFVFACLEWLVYLLKSFENFSQFVLLLNQALTVTLTLECTRIDEDMVQ